MTEMTLAQAAAEVLRDLMRDANLTREAMEANPHGERSVNLTMAMFVKMTEKYAD